MRLLVPPVFVPFDTPLVGGTLLSRNDRFVAKVRLDGGEVVDSHCVNPGRMEGFVADGARVWLQPQSKAGRRCPYTWEIIERHNAGAPLLCSTNTVRPNLLVSRVLEARALRGLDDWVALKPEHTIKEPAAAAAKTATTRIDEHTIKEPDAAAAKTATTRIDFLLSGAGARDHYVEVKNCHLVCDADGWGYFPDSVSERAVKHCDELSALAARGEAATVLIVVQRADVRHGVRPSTHHDPAFAAAARRAAAAGVRFRALRAEVGLEGTTITHELPVDLGEYDAAPVAAQCERDRAATGWVRSASGQRVANGPFAHHKPPKRPTAARATKRKEGAKQASAPDEPAAAAEPQTGPRGPAARKRSRYFLDTTHG